MMIEAQKRLGVCEAENGQLTQTKKEKQTSPSKLEADGLDGGSTKAEVSIIKNAYNFQTRCNYHSLESLSVLGGYGRNILEKWGK